MKRLMILALGIVLASIGLGWAGPEPVVAAGAPQKKRLIVGFRQGVGAAERDKALRDMGLASVGDLDPFNALLAEPADGKFRPSAMQLMENPKVLLVEEDFYANWLNEGPAGMAQIPLPGLAHFQDALKGAAELAPPLSEGEIPWGVNRVKAPDAWTRNQGEGVRVAVIDTGIDFTHPDLAPNYSGGINYVDSGKPPLDDHGHGTHVAGTIAAVRDGKGVVGVAPRARLYAVKVLNKDGGGSLSDVVKGILWCANNGIQVANMSLGSPTDSAFEHWAVMYAESQGVSIVASAGNRGPGDGTVGYPGSYPEVISVAASDIRNHVAEFSSRGDPVQFIAPGVDVLSDAPGGQLAVHSGTSMAAPHVSGLAALAVRAGAKGAAQVREMLKSAATPLPRLKTTEQGAGLVDAARVRQTGP